MSNAFINHEDLTTVLTALENCPEEKRSEFVKSMLPNTLLQEELKAIVASWKEKQVNPTGVSTDSLAKSFSDKYGFKPVKTDENND